VKLASDQLVLDTNILLHWLRGKEAGAKLRTDYALGTRTPRPILPLVVKAEIKSLALQFEWIGVMLFWFAATVLRGRRDAFAFGTLGSGLAAVALLFVVNPDAVVARVNVARMATADAPVRFDVAYATSLSADAVPVLVGALPSLPDDVQCPLARHMLRRWPPDRERSIRSWNWSASRAGDAVREHEAQLRSMAGPGQECATPGVD
jgi:hypothetical protein